METCAPPDPDTRKPCVGVPANACDTHCHIFGPAASFPYAEGRSYTPPDAPLEDFQRLQDILGLDRAVIVQASCQGTDNSAILDAIARGGGRYRGVAMIDDGFTRADLEALDAGGIRGVRISFVRNIGGAPDPARLRRTAEKIAPLGWHLVLHSNVEDVVEHAGAIAALPVPVVIDHMARVKTADGVDQTPFRQLLELIGGKDIWIKISGAERISAAGPPYADAVPFAQALIDAAPDRILWGTDWPHPTLKGPMPNDGDLVDLLAQHAPDEAARTKILVDNPARLYGFDA